MQHRFVGALDAQETNGAYAVDDEDVTGRHLRHPLRPRSGGHERDDERRNHRSEDTHVLRVLKARWLVETSTCSGAGSSFVAGPHRLLNDADAAA